MKIVINAATARLGVKKGSPWLRVMTIVESGEACGGRLMAFSGYAESDYSKPIRVHKGIDA
jgi:hypothetical protein